VRIKAPSSLLLALLAIVAAAGIATPASAQQEGEPRIVRVGVGRDYPPYGYADPSGKPAGFNVDLIRAIGEEMGFETELHLGIWTALKDALKAGELDMLGAMLRSDRRESWVDFSKPVLDVEYGIFVRQGTRGIGSLDDLKDRTFLAQGGSWMHEYLIDAGLGDNVVPVESEPEAMRILNEGQFVAAVVPYRPGKQIAVDFELQNVEPAGPPILSAALCFAVFEGDAELRALLDEGLARLRSNGRFQEIYNTHFGIDRKAAGARSGPDPLWLAAGGLGLVVLAGLAAALFQLVQRQRARRASGGANVLGNYELIEKIGQGGMGEVWRARHRTLSRHAAIKLVRVETLQGDSESADNALMRFEREARATAALRSAHTIQLYDYGTTADGSVYYAMELLDGLDLQSLVERFGQVPASRAIYLMRQACESLEEAHRGGLLHRDIKPANIFACHLGTAHDVVKVLDFGLVKLRGSAGKESVELTTTDMVTGTPLCIAPEMVLGEVEVDERADVYALGCVLYWLLTGKPVFSADNPVAMAVAHATEDVVPPSQRADLDISPALEAVVLSCLKKDRADRPASAAALSSQLAECGPLPLWTPALADAWWEEHAPEIATSGSRSAAAVLADTR
jgi:serine/threonine-protein kinase